jgi:hypothetical protein
MSPRCHARLNHHASIPTHSFNLFGLSIGDHDGGDDTGECAPVSRPDFVNVSLIGIPNRWSEHGRFGLGGPLPLPDPSMRAGEPSSMQGKRRFP